MANHEEEAVASSDSFAAVPESTEPAPNYEQNYSTEQSTESNDQGYNPEQAYGSEQNFAQNDQSYGQEQSFEQPASNDFGYQQNEVADSSADQFANNDYSAPTEQSYEQPQESAEEHPFDFSKTLDHIPEPTPAPKVSDDANFADVIEFANTNTGGGPLSYTVFIDGVESSQLVYQLREAMTDSRFGWDVNELLTHIGGGRLTLKGLTPAKASVLINRIKYLPFKISWRQDVLSGS